MQTKTVGKKVSPVVFAVEPYAAVREAGEKGLFQKHWEDLAFDKVIPWDMNHELYGVLEKGNMLHVVTARSAGVIVGYHLATICPHLHYKNAGEMCYEDMYYILPEFRK